MIRIKGARVLDPGHTDENRDIIIKNGRIESIVDPSVQVDDPDITTVDAAGMLAVPGLVDMHVHLREPGHEYKETIETGLRAAAAGGFTTVCPMPNTDPVNDSSRVTRFIISRAKEAGYSKVMPVGAATRGSDGKTLAEYADMKDSGICAVSDDGRPVKNSLMMRRVLEYADGLDLPVFSHAEDLDLADGGSMNEGRVATSLGIRGIPDSAETVMVIRDIELSRLTGSRVHICHVSTKESVRAVRRAKQEGIPVTCETAPHYFTLTHQAVMEYDTNAKMNPPLRTEEDRQAILDGLCDGTIDVIASDHAPHSVLEKDLEFDRAAFGIVGLETSLPLCLKLLHEGVMSIETIVEKMAKNPAGILGYNNDLKPGAAADITIIDPDAEFSVKPEYFHSKGKNTPFSGWNLKGRAFCTIIDGRVISNE
ncbi:MAG: dihydroorotase [Thermodesulfobacteriota bacterium]